MEPIAYPIEMILVDDNPDEVELALRALKNKHLDKRVLVLHDGAKVLDYLFEKTSEGNRNLAALKVILLDFKLPKVSGVEVLQKIKADPKTRAIPVVMLTSSPEDSDIASCYQLGVNSYIVKPVELDHFFETIARVGHYWLETNRPSRETLPQRL